MNDSHNKPISAFDEIHHLTIETMRKMELEVLIELLKQAQNEYHKAETAINALTTAINKKTRMQHPDDSSCK